VCWSKGSSLKRGNKAQKATSSCVEKKQEDQSLGNHRSSKKDLWEVKDSICADSLCCREAFQKEPVGGISIATLIALTDSPDNPDLWQTCVSEKEGH
jgi:hypothetical protein